MPFVCSNASVSLNGSNKFGNHCSRRSTLLKVYTNITLLMTWRLQSWHKGDCTASTHEHSLWQTAQCESHSVRGGTSSCCLPSWLSTDLKKKCIDHENDLNNTIIVPFQHERTTVCSICYFGSLIRFAHFIIMVVGAPSLASPDGTSLIFYYSEFWATCACPENRVCPKNLHCIEIFFIFQDFWATCACPEIFKPGGVPPPPPRAPLCLTSQMLTAKSCFKSTKNKWLSISLLTALRNIWNFDRDNLHACAPMSTPIWFISLFLRTSKFYVRMPSFLSHYWILAWLMSERRYSWGAVKVFCSYQCWLCANTYSACL